MSGCDEVWKCKCGCTSKHSHKARWAFISTYKRNYSSKYTKANWDNDDLNTESNLVKKLKIIHTRTNNKQYVPIKKVKYDEISKQIVVEIDEPKRHELKKAKKNANKKNTNEIKKMIIEKELVELRELIKIR